MSMQLMVQALKAKVGNPGRKLVLIKLADNANDKGECWPSYQHVADQCEMGRSTVKAHIKALEDAGFLTVIERNGGKSSNRFKLHIESGNAESTRSESDPVKNEPGQDLTPTRSESDPLTRSESDPRTSHSSEPTIEPITKKPSRAKRNSGASDPRVDDRFARFWEVYPNKVSKGQAEKTFRKLNPDDLLLKRMINALRAQIDHRAQADAAGHWMPQWKNPSTWLNGKCWEDQLAPIEATPRYSRSGPFIPDNNDLSWADGFDPFAPETF